MAPEPRLCFAGLLSGSLPITESVWRYTPLEALPKRETAFRGRFRFALRFAGTIRPLPELLKCGFCWGFMVRPDRVELPTFWFVDMQSGGILLILMPATTRFEANTWRITAAIDERLMKGFSRDQLFQIDFSSASFLPASGAGAVARMTTPSGVPIRSSWCNVESRPPGLEPATY